MAEFIIDGDYLDNKKEKYSIKDLENFLSFPFTNIKIFKKEEKKYLQINNGEKKEFKDEKIDDFEGRYSEIKRINFKAYEFIEKNFKRIENKNVPKISIQRKDRKIELKLFLNNEKLIIASDELNKEFYILNEFYFDKNTFVEIYTEIQEKSKKRYLLLSNNNNKKYIFEIMEETESFLEFYLEIKEKIFKIKEKTNIY